MPSDDPVRRAAEQAAYDAIERFETDLVVRPAIWRIVMAALDAMEDERVARSFTSGTLPAWTICHEDGRPWVTLPTRRSARQQRVGMAVLADVPRRKLRIYRSEVVQF